MVAGNGDSIRRRARRSVIVLAAAALLGGSWLAWRRRAAEPPPPFPSPVDRPQYISKLFDYSRGQLDDGGLVAAWSAFRLPVRDPSSLTAVRDAVAGVGSRGARLVEAELAHCLLDPEERLEGLLLLARLHLYEGRFQEASAALAEARRWAEDGPFRIRPRERELTTLFFQGVAALRRGEVENCVACCGGASCILPLSPEAVHQKPGGSQEAVRHFTELLRQRPDSMAARWLLNLACATLGEYPQGVPSPYLIPLWPPSPDSGVGRFRNIAAQVGLDRLNQAGGAIMDDFDNDGLLDILTSSMDPRQPMAYYRNRGDGTFEDRSRAAGLGGQLGGLYCVQTDFNNDGFLDVFVCRGAWTMTPQRPSLLRNNGDGTFTDVTVAAGLETPVDSQVAAWADYDNDGWLDLFVGAESVRSRLYHNRGDGTFEEVALRAGVAGPGLMCKGAAWGDYDGDGLPDLFVNHLNGPPCLFHNNGNGTFTDVAPRLGLAQPAVGFPCWFWDYDNDGHLDLFAAGYETRLEAVVRSWLGLPHDGSTPRLYRNRGDGTFADVTAAAGLDKALCPMGSNFVDVDNDGFLDFYLGTGTPDYSMLVPNRLFQNVGGRCFVDVTAPSGTGHLQKGHAVACGDWDRDGNVDIFEEMGGATPGDQAHNVLFQNPGHDHHWITVKLVGKKTNRAAVGARIKVTLAGGPVLYRTVTSGGSFGGNALEQTIGLGRATEIRSLEVYWPASRTVQTFRDVPPDQALEITEFAPDSRRLNWSRVPVAPADPAPLPPTGPSR